MPKSLLELLRQRSLGLYILGNALTNAGTWVKDIAAAIYLFQLTGSATMVASVALAGYGSAVFLAPVGGVFADRFDRVRLLAVIHLVQGLAAFLLAALVHLGRAGPVTVFGLLLVIGVGKALVMPALHAVLPSIVDKADLAPALTLQSLTFNGTRAVGPLLGATVATVVSPALAFGVNGVAFLLFVVLLPFISVRTRAAPRGPAQTSRSIVGRALREPRIRLLLVGMAVVGMVTDPFITLGPSFAQMLGTTEGFAGVLVAGFGVGSLLSAPFVGRIRLWLGAVRAAAFGLVGVCAGLGLLASAPTPGSAVVASGLTGAGFLIASMDFTASLQEILPSQLRGRVMSLWTVAYFGSRPVAAIVAGTFADRWSPRVGLLPILAATVAMLLTCLYGYPRRDWRAMFASS